MTRPLILQVVIGVVLGAALTMLWLGILGNDPGEALRVGTVLFFAAGGLAIALWVLFLVLFRKRYAAAGKGGRFGWSLLAASIAGIANIVVGSIVGLIAGGWDAFLVLFVFIATVAFGIGALIANLITSLAFAPNGPPVTDPTR